MHQCHSRPPATEASLDGGADRAALMALAGLADTAVPPLLMMALMAAEQHGKIEPDLRRLALTLRELQAAVLTRAAGPASCGSAVRRLYDTVNILKLAE